MLTDWRFYSEKQMKHFMKFAELVLSICLFLPMIWCFQKQFKIMIIFGLSKNFRLSFLRKVRNISLSSYILFLVTVKIVKTIFHHITESPHFDCFDELSKKPNVSHQMFQYRIPRVDIQECFWFFFSHQTSKSLISELKSW